MKFEQLPINSLSINVASLISRTASHYQYRYIILKSKEGEFISITKVDAYRDTFFNANAERRVILV